MKFNADSYWFKSGFFSLLQNFSTLIFGFGGFYLLVRILSKDDFGGWTLFLTATSLLEVARVGFLKNGFIKFRASSGDDDKATLFSASLFLNTCFALLISIGMLVLAGWFSRIWNAPMLQNMFYIYALTSLALIPFFQFEFLLHALLDFKGVFVSYFVRNLVLFSGILLGFFGVIKINLWVLAGFHLAGVVIASAVTYLLVRKSLDFKWRVHREWVWRLTHYGKYVIGTSLSSMLYGAVDQFMLGSLLSSASVATFSVANRITNLISIPSTTLSTIMFPQSARLMSTDGKEAVKELYEKSVGIILGIVLPAIVFILIFPGFVITVIAGDGYPEVVAILRVTIFFSLLLPFSYQFGTVLDSIGYPNLNFYYTTVNLLVNIALNFLMISRYGIMGAVYGTLFTMMAGFVAMQIILKIILNISTLKVFVHTWAFYKSLFVMSGNYLRRNTSHDTAK